MAQSNKAVIVSVLILCMGLFWTTRLAATSGPFPVKGQIYDKNDQLTGTAHVYPRYVEIYSLANQKVGRVGILVEKGMARLFLVDENENHSLVGYAEKGKLKDRNDTIVGSYFATPTWSFIYDKDNKRAGKVKCIAWPRVCAVGVGGYLLDLYGESNGNAP